MGSLDVTVEEGPASRSGSVCGADEDDEFSIPGLVQDRLFCDGYWDHLNQALDLMFGEHESESVEPAKVHRMAELTTAFAERYVGRREEWTGSVHQTLIDLGNFLRAARRESELYVHL